MVRLFLFCLFVCGQLSAHVVALYLTWVADPTTTMTIRWFTLRDESSDISLQLISPDQKQTEFRALNTSLEHLSIHTVELSRLSPDTEYQFYIGEDPTIYKFRTAPKTLERPIRCIIGGDADQTTKLFHKMNETIAKKDPLFCVIGGDIAYAINTVPFQFSSRAALNRWISFFSTWKEQLITEDGRLIPLLVCAGNHDLSESNSELFFSLFPFSEKKLYRAVDFGNYLSLILLDTNHYHPIEGEQTDWLNQTLAKRTSVPFRFAIYHEAAYPSYYSFQGITPKKIRTFWCPLFDKYHLTAAFENHNHAFKRTKPLTNGEIDPEGIIYFGDGCWGAKPRKTNDMWYLAERGRKNNVYLIELSSKEAQIEAIDLLARPLDTIKLELMLENN